MGGGEGSCVDNKLNTGGGVFSCVDNRLYTCVPFYGGVHDIVMVLMERHCVTFEYAQRFVPLEEDFAVSKTYTKRANPRIRGGGGGAIALTRHLPRANEQFEPRHFRQLRRTSKDILGRTKNKLQKAFWCTYIYIYTSVTHKQFTPSCTYITQINTRTHTEFK